MDGSEYVPEEERAAYREWVRSLIPNPELDTQVEAWIERDNIREHVRERLSRPGAMERLQDIIARGRLPHDPRRVARWEAALLRTRDKRKPYDVNDPDRVRAPAGVPPEALEHAASIILAARARRLDRPDPTDSGD